uniref:MULE transposase domain-containing protein n=1 Tax=Nicotiana tabacum TaxID=4097 RepID=A0A1S3WZ28_TOBAC|nr:PREDICTED: uncharacterized protein LOC107759461 [Nicotiana tabacum]
MEQHDSHGLDDIEEDLLNIDIPKMDHLNMDIPETEEQEYANFPGVEGSHIAKAMVRGTPEHEYAILDAYRYALRKANEGSKMELKLDNCGKFQYFLIAYESWSQGFLFMRKVIAVDGTFLIGKYREVLLSAVAQDSENHIFGVAFCVVDKECDAAYEYCFEQLSSIHPDSVELCIISDRHISIPNGNSNFYPKAHHKFCMRHLAENIRKIFYCGDLLHHYYSAAKAYRIDEL